MSGLFRNNVFLFAWTQLLYAQPCPRVPAQSPNWSSRKNHGHSLEVGLVPGRVVHVLENFPHQLFQVFAGSLFFLQRFLHLLVILSTKQTGHSVCWALERTSFPQEGWGPCQLKPWAAICPVLWAWVYSTRLPTCLNRHPRLITQLLLGPRPITDGKIVLMSLTIKLRLLKGRTAVGHTLRTWLGIAKEQLARHPPPPAPFTPAKILQLCRDGTNSS